MKRKYRIALVLWLALGVGASGALHIFALPEYRSDRNRNWDNKYSYEERYRKRDIAILVTAVGSILIGGFGLVIEKKEND